MRGREGLGMFKDAVWSLGVRMGSDLYKYYGCSLHVLDCRALHATDSWDRVRVLYAPCALAAAVVQYFPS